MKQHQKMPLKTFTQEYNKILHSSSADDLRAMLLGMANKVSSQLRWDFIKKLVPTPSIQDAPRTFETNILDEIASLKKDILAQRNELNWEWDASDDSLGEYEKFLQPLSDLFDKVTLLFDAGHYEIAKSAYQKLFAIFEIRVSECTHIFHVHNIVNTDLDEARARYFCSLYMTSQKKDRVRLLLKAMGKLGNLDYRKRPRLYDMDDVVMDPLPEFSTFLTQWIDATSASLQASHDAWLREATVLLHGAEGLETLAKIDGHKRPRAHVEWMRFLIDENRYKEALDAGRTALSQLPEGKPIRAAIGDFMAYCGEELHDKKVQFEGLRVSFDAKPDLSKLIHLYKQVSNLDRSSLMKQAAGIIEVYLEKSNIWTYPYYRAWEWDDLEMGPRPSSTLLLHAYLFSGDLDKAYALAKKGTTEKWGFDNPQPFFIAYCLISVAKVSLNNLPLHLKRFWEYALSSSGDSIWDGGDNINNIFQNLELIYQDIFSMPREIDKKILDWCLMVSEQRVNSIGIHFFNEKYDETAPITTACVEALQSINPVGAAKILQKLQSKFPHYSLSKIK